MQTFSTDRPTAARFTGRARIHVGLAVSDLERSIAFYRALLWVPPSKRRPGYAKFEPTEPSLNLSLSAQAGPLPARRGGAEHFGLELRSSAEVLALAERMRAAGHAVRLEENVTCCHAVQDKAWFVDPDGNPWEGFVVSEAEAPAQEPTSCCGPAGSAACSSSEGAST